jgi:hypothetical protein
MVIRNVAATVNTVVFLSQFLIQFLFASIGRNGSTPITVPITFHLYMDFGLNVVQTSSTVLTGTEGYAIVRFPGTFTSIGLIIQFRILFKHYIGFKA